LNVFTTHAVVRVRSSLREDAANGIANTLDLKGGLDPAVVLYGDKELGIVMQVEADTEVAALEKAWLAIDIALLKITSYEALNLEVEAEAPAKASVQLKIHYSGWTDRVSVPVRKANSPSARPGRRFRVRHAVRSIWTTITS
jgi:hypothetical protein